MSRVWNKMRESEESTMKPTVLRTSLPRLLTSKSFLLVDRLRIEWSENELGCVWLCTFIIAHVELEDRRLSKNVVQCSGSLGSIVTWAYSFKLLKIQPILGGPLDKAERAFRFYASIRSQKLGGLRLRATNISCQRLSSVACLNSGWLHGPPNFFELAYAIGHRPSPGSFSTTRLLVQS